MIRAAFLACLLLGLPSPVTACQPYPGDAWAPPGYSGCELDGPTNGVASVWPGDVAAANWCRFPWKDCTPIRVQSHKTGLTIEVTPAMYCHCWVGVTGPAGETQRLVDLTVGQVRALGLDPSDGLFDVLVTPVWSVETLPDTAQMFYNEQDGGVSADPDTIRGGPGPELTPRAGAAPRHEGKS